MTDSNIITVTEFGQFAPEVDTSKYDAPTLSGMISAASKIATDYLEYTPFAEDIANEVVQGLITTEGDLLIFPKKLPIQTVSAISITRGATTVALTITNGAGVNKFNIDYTQRNIRYPYQEITLQGVPVFTDFYSLRGRQFYTKVSYRGGWEPSALPGSIKQAVVLLMKDLVSGQYNQMGANRLRQGAVEFEFGSTGMGESKLVKDAKRLLGPYRRVG